MNHYLIIVEGAHDIAVIEKVLRINGVNQKIASEDDLPEIWNKAKVGCIANVMKPGKANQVSIADNDWVSEKTLKSSQMLGRLNEEIKKMCGL